MKNLIVIIISVFAFTTAYAQEKSDGIVETTFKVDGVCGMCKDRIESAAMRTKGVKLAKWDVDKKELKVVYKSDKTTEKEIQQAVADHGHTTSLVEADSTAYSKLPGCCRYKDGAKCDH
jgi:copper chaperone CopZ